MARMKSSISMPLLLLSSTIAAYGAPPILNVASSSQAVFNEPQNIDRGIVEDRQYIKQNNLLYEFMSHPDFQNYNLRMAEPTLCDPSVKQYSGYLDVAGSADKHLFFWFFESRSAPADAPLILWLNGGPGCSSTTGLLFELGPCAVQKDGKNTTRNPYSWNSDANIIFLDQPVGVGFSYSDNGTEVFTTPEAGKDVYAFLELFLNRFPEYSKAPFHFAGESYGGTYVPNFAKIIYEANRELAIAPNSRVKHINLASIIIANGLTEPYTQLGSIPDQVCKGPYPIYDDPNGRQCNNLRLNVAVCQRLIQTCYTFNSKLTCVPAHLYCFDQIFGLLAQSGRNVYDARQKCREEDSTACYPQMRWIDSWMNDPSNMAELGVSSDKKFESCNNRVNGGFARQGDAMHNSALLLPELIDAGVKLLVYNGNADMLCNPVGSETWVEAMQTKFSSEFAQTKARPWVVPELRKIAGEFRSAGGGRERAGNITFVNIYEAGHMAPYDQPEASLDLITKWIMDLPLTSV